MRAVRQRPQGVAFEAWRRRAEAARDALIEEWREEQAAAVRENRPVRWDAKIDEKLYKEIREHFLRGAFWGKCAYCEANHSDGHPVQVEHFRPKKAVTERRQPVAHPGYFWVAYEWSNLLPSCASCNTHHTDPKRGTTHPGKLNEFPVGAARVISPGADVTQWEAELAAEKPGLLNPYFDAPEREIDFDQTTGAAIGITERGKITVDVCDLRRPSLNDKRLAQEYAVDGILGRLHLQQMSLPDLVTPAMEYSAWLIRRTQTRLQELCKRCGLEAQVQ